jgi:hypothetical protein
LTGFWREFAKKSHQPLTVAVSVDGFLEKLKGINPFERFSFSIESPVKNQANQGKGVIF